MVRLLLIWMLSGALGLVGYDWWDGADTAPTTTTTEDGTVTAQEGGQHPPPSCCP